MQTLSDLLSRHCYTRRELENDLYFQCYSVQIVSRELLLIALDDCLDRAVAEGKKLRPFYDREEIVWKVGVALRKSRNEKVGHTGRCSYADWQTARKKAPRQHIFNT